MKHRINDLVERVRSGRLVRWPWQSEPDAAKPSSADGSGRVVQRDVAQRLKNLSVAERGTSLGDPGPETGTFRIRLARPPGVRRQSESPLQKRYARRGYRTSATRVDAHVCTFSAYDGGRMAGTVSVRLDSAEGLAADVLYRAETDALRREGRRICEFIRLAVDTTRVSQPVLAGLLHTVFLFAQKLRGFNFVVIEVNPRHVGFYKRALGFEVIGAERHNPRLNATAVLMGVSLRDIGENLHGNAGKGKRAAPMRNLYTYGFSLAEEAGILGRLRSLDPR